MDIAIWRRFDEVVLFDLPKDHEILQLLYLKMRNFPPDFSLEKKVIKLRGLSYSDIERICNNSIRRSIINRSKVVLESEFGIAIQDERRRQKIKTKLRLRKPSIEK